MSLPSKTARYREPAHFAVLRLSLPNEIDITVKPERMIDLDKQDLTATMADWFHANVHHRWTWDVVLAPNDLIVLKFFFASVTDAVFFRLAHSY